MDLVRFLTARLAEDEAWARSIADRYGSRNWSFYDDAARGAAIFDKTQTLVAWTEPGAGDLADWFTGNDPARALAEVAAKRAILDAYVRRDEQSGGTESFAQVAGHHATGLGIAVRRLAAVYADHPDYRQEWAG